MSVTAPSDPREIQEFQFKLICRLHVFDQKDEDYKSSFNLVAPASKYGLLFIGFGKKIQAILLPRVLEMEHPTEQTSSRGASHGGTEICNYPRRELLLPDIVTNLHVNCDQNLLAVAVTKGGCAHALIYDIASFHGKTVNLVKEIRLTTSPDTHVLELSWNPGISNILASCLSNGTVVLYEFKNGGVDINGLPPESQATCFSWSPKGKQLVVGSLNGTLTQYKPDLKAVKSIPPPAVFENPASVVNVLWISNYQFAAVYRDAVNESERPSLLIVNAPKAAAVTFVNYEDICYSSGDLRRSQFYLLHQQNWNVLVVGSANSMEVGVLGLTSDQMTWEQWLQEDASRAELPLTSSKEETFPLGIGLDTSTQKQLPWGENQFLPPMPVLIILSHKGVLCLFYVINTLPQASMICTPPEKLPDESMLVHFTTSSGNDESSSVPQENTTSQSVVDNTPQPSKSVDWSTPLGVSDTNRMGLRVNLTERFENIAPSHLQNVAKASFPITPGESTKSSSDSPRTANPPNAASGPLDFNSKPSALQGMGSIFSGLTTQPSIESGSPGNILAAQGNTKLNFSIPAATSTPIFEVQQPRQQPPQTQPQKQEQISFNVQQQPSQQPFQLPSFQTQPLPFSQMQQKPVQQQLVQQPQITVQLQQSPPQLQQQIQQHPLVQKAALLQQAESSVTISPSCESKIVSNSNNYSTVVTENSQVAPTSSGNNVNDELANQAKEIINSKVLYVAIEEEMKHFENDLAALKIRLRKLNTEVGTSEEKTKLRRKVDIMDNFCRELKETTSYTQCCEVQTLKAELVESLAWAEDANSRAVQQNDPCWLQVIRSQELDPGSAQNLANMKQLSYYVESQLNQADRSLDLQWANFQESCRDKIKGRLYIPSLEAVYQAMVLQSNILLKQKSKVKNIMEKAAKHKMSKGGSLSILRTNIARVQSKSGTDLAALAENLLQMRLEAANSSGVAEDISEIIAAGRYSMVASMNSKLTPEKQATLREFLTQRPVQRIRPTKPSSTCLKSLSLLEKHSKSHEITPLKPATDTNPLGHLDNMVARMGTESINGLKGSHLNSVPRETVGLNTGLSSKENMKMMGLLSTGGDHHGDLFGHIAKSVVTKFKEPDAAPYIPLIVSSGGDENTKHQLMQSAVGFNSNVQATNNQNSTFSFSSVPTSSLAKSKATVNFNFSSSPKQPSTQFGESLTKSDSETSFTLKAPTVTTASSTFVTSSSTSAIVFSGTTNKPAGFNFFTGASAPTTSASVQFFGSVTSSTTGFATASVTTISKLHSSDSSTMGTIVSSTTSTPSMFGGKVNFGQATVPGTTVSQTKPSQTPSFFGNLGLSNSATDFSFSVPSTQISSQNTSGSVKSIFGGTPAKNAAESAIPDSSSQSTANKSALPAFGFFGSGNSQTSSEVTITAIATTQPPPSSFSSGVNAQEITNFNLGQLNSALSITPAAQNQETTKEVSAVEKSEQSAISTSVSDSLAVSSTTTPPVSSTPIKPFTFSLSGITTPSSSVPDTNTSTTDENEKNKPPVTSAPVSFFGQAVCSPSSLTQNASSIFGQKTPASIFGGGGSTVASPTSAPEDKAASGTAVSESSLSAVAAATSSDTAAGVASPVTSTSVFGGSALVSSLPNIGTPVSATTATASTTTTVSTTPSLFANAVSNTSLFGNATTTPGSVFSGTPTTSAPAFGSGSSFFGQTSTVSNSSIFKPQGTATVAPVFGQTTTANTTTTAGSIFGQATASASIFGQAVTSTTSSSMFGQSSTSTAAASIFGQQAATTTGSIFGQQASTTTSTVFGQPTSTASVFGQPSATTAASIFGQPVATTATSVFGQPAATTSASVFGSNSTGTSLFGQPTSTTSSIFGQPTTTATSAFGGTGNAFGQSPGSFLGGGTQPAFGSSPTFGQSGGSIFGQNTGSGFGSSGGSIFGGSSTYGKSGNLFQSPSGGSIFGGSTSSGVSPGGAFSAPVGQSIAESGFGSPSAFGQQNKQGGFGSPPAFGQASASGGSSFGGSPTFGGAPTFGGSPVFGSANRVFGSPASPPTANLFAGGSQQQSNTFENLATQNTMTFGNLASGQTPAFGTSGGSVFGGAVTSQPQAPAFQNTPSFGGSSFSSWR